MSAPLGTHLARAAALIRFIQQHGDKLDKLRKDARDDIPLAISVAHDFHETFKAADIESSVAAAQATAPNMAQPKKISAPDAAAHVEAHGLSDSERMIFERASASSG